MLHGRLSTRPRRVSTFAIRLRTRALPPASVVTRMCTAPTPGSQLVALAAHLAIPPAPRPSRLRRSPRPASTRAIPGTPVSIPGNTSAGRPDTRVARLLMLAIRPETPAARVHTRAFPPDAAPALAAPGPKPPSPAANRQDTPPLPVRMVAARLDTRAFPADAAPTPAAPLMAQRSNVASPLHTPCDYRDATSRKHNGAPTPVPRSPNTTSRSAQPHSLNPQTWHFTQPSANSSCEPQSGQVPMKLCVCSCMFVN